MSKFKVSSSKSSILSYPTAKPELSLDFVNTPEGIDPAYSFTRNSAATYVGPDGFIKTAAVNQPRFDFDPVTGDVKGLLVEESRTNLLTYSTTFDVAWTDTNITRNTTTALAPDGTNSALRVTAGNDNATIIRNSAVGSTNTRTFSIYLRRVSGSGNIQFTWNGGSSWVTITQSITNTWSRFILITNSVNHRVGLRIVTTGDSIELWGSQLEVGFSVSSYIPTTTTTVTRQPDQLVLNKPLSTQGTLYVESRPTTGISLVADNGSSPLVVSQNPNQYSKSVLYYNTDRTLRMSSDGGVPVDFSSFLAPENLNRVSLGFNRLNNTAYINGHLKKFSYYSSPLTEDNLRALTGNKRSIFRFTSLEEPIVTLGLVLNLDAGNPASYPGSGTTWTDLSGFGNNGTLVNGVGYNSSNLGSLSFDGVDDYATIPHSSILNFNTALTISIWFYSGITTAWWLYLKGRTDADNYNPLVYSNGRYGWTGPNGRSFYEPPSGFIQSNTWYNLTVSHISGNNPNIYRNAVVSTSHTYSEGSGARALGTNTNPVGINADVPRGTIGTFNGRIASIQAYNRALTAQEIQQNFNALRGRFGI
jgi:hypothetical protein